MVIAKTVLSYFASVIIELRGFIPVKSRFTIVVLLRSLFLFLLVVSKFVLCFPCI